MSEEIRYSELEHKIGYTFKNKDLFVQALTHRSYLNENPDFSLGHNERLEFLGDAVLELAVTEYLYEEYPGTTEGAMTNYRSALVKGAHLAEVATQFPLEDYILMSRGERTDITSRAYITANAVEALIAAIYLDGGMEAAIQFVYRFIAPDLAEIIDKKLFIDAKSLLQETAQEQQSITPQYEVVRSWGPDHNKMFEVIVRIGEKESGRGTGKSKQKAEQSAAENALEIQGLR